MKTRHIAIVTFAALILACVLVLQPGPGRYAAALVLTLLPGFAPCWPLGRFSSRADGFFVRTALGVALGLGLSTLLFLVLAHLGLAHATIFPAVLAAMGAGLLCLPPHKQGAKDPMAPLLPGGWALAALGVLAVAAYLRFTHLGYSDFQNDETHSVLRVALQILSGEDGAISHARRPPMQMAWAAMSHLLAGTMDEGVVRAPFALAGTMACVAATLLGAVLFGPAAGALGGLLWALNGFVIGFSRYVQYQPAVCLFLAGSALCLALALLGPQRRSSLWLILGCFLFGLAGATHYEGLLFAPVPIYAMLRLGWPKSCWWALLAFAAPAALAYLPMLLSPAFGDHMQYYEGNRYRSPINFNIGYILILGTVYTSWGYLLLLLLGTAALFAFASKNPRERLSRNLLLAWFTPYFLVYFVLMSIPRSHVYTYYLPWSLMAAAGVLSLPRLLDWLATKCAARFGALPRLPELARRPAVSAVLVTLLMGWTAVHVQQRFVDHTPEYPWYKDRRPSRSLYGFPFLRGWEAVGYLFRTGELNGTYASNEYPRISSYYLRQPPVGLDKAELYVYSPKPETWQHDHFAPDGFVPVVQVMIGDQPGLTVYRRSTAVDGQGEVRVLHARDYDDRYPALDYDRDFSKAAKAGQD